MGILDVNRSGIVYASWARRYRLARPDHWWRERECPRCGRREVLVPYPGYVVLCPHCASRWRGIEELARSGRAVRFVAWSREVRCNECGAWSPVMVQVRPGWLCLKCIWELGGGRGPLKVAGSRW